MAYSAMSWRMYRSERVGTKKNKSLLIRAVIMVVIFSLSWVPAFIIIDIVKRTGTCPLKWFAQVLLYLNTLTDPLIYVLTPKMMKRLAKQVRSNPKNESGIVAGVSNDIDNVVQMVPFVRNNPCAVCSNYGSRSTSKPEQ